MRDHIGIDTLANWVSMLRADIDGAILLVDNEIEGQFYDNCTHSAARVVPSPNAALSLLERIHSRQISGVVATVSSPSPQKQLPPAVFQPSLGDAASVLLNSKCADTTIEEIGGAPWVKACSKDIDSIIDRMISLAWLIHNERPQRDVPIETGRAAEFVDWSRLVPTFTVGGDPDIETFTKAVQAEGRFSLLGGCDGMLAIELISASTIHFRPRGLSASRTCTPADLLSMMRLAFELSELEADRLYWHMRGWERANPRFPLLRQWRLMDPLQVVFDQRYWEPDLSALLEADSSNDYMTAIKLDLDNFKIVNEKLGHSAGDEAIKLACLLVCDVFRGAGEVYRRGGDEIVVLAPGLDVEGSVELAEKLRSLIAERFAAWGQQRGLDITPTASIGVVNALTGCRAADVSRLLDEAQGTAKLSGKNRVTRLTCSLDLASTDTGVKPTAP